VTLNLRWEILHVDLLLCGAKRNGALDRVFQLPHVARHWYAINARVAPCDMCMLAPGANLSRSVSPAAEYRRGAREAAAA
jgi:hypothetical protein